MAPKLTRRKEIKKIEDINKRRVTFWKRRKGLFKKANELRKLFDAEIAIITFSDAGSVFTFGHPSVASVIQRYKAHESSSDKKYHGNVDENDETEQCPADDWNMISQMDLDLVLSLSLNDPAVHSSSARDEGNHDENEQYLPENDETEDCPDDDENNSVMDLALSSSMNYQEKDDDSGSEESEKGLIFPGVSEEKIQETWKIVEEGHSNSKMPIWDLPVEMLQLHELEQLMAQMEKMKKKVLDQTNWMGRNDLVIGE